MWLQTGKPCGQQIENDPESYFLLGTLSPEERRLLDPSDLRNAAALRALPMASAMERYRQDVLENGGLTRWTT